MIKRILFIIFFIFSVFFINNIFTEEANAQSRISFCSTYADSQASGATCKFSCGDFTYDTLRSAISKNATAKCTGRATNFKITIRKLELGTSSGYNATGDNARCEIFNGTLVTNVGPASPDQVLANKPLTFNKCKEVVYDRIYVTVDRKFVFAANATFPTSAGSYVARTTSACASDPLSLSVTALGWFDSNKDNSGTNCYVRSTQTTNSSDVFIKTKLGSLGVETDYSSMTSNVDNDYDDFKSVYLDAIGGDTSGTATFLTNDSTFYDPGGLGGFEGEKIDSSDSTREIMVFIKGSDIITGSGFGVKFDKKKTQSLELNYYAGNQTKGYGARFLFKRVDTLLGVTDVQIMGARPDDNGIFITFNQY
jgi:hypothetical protein